MVKVLGAEGGRAIALKQEMAQKQLALAQAEMIKVDADLRRLEIEAKVCQANAGAELKSRTTSSMRPSTKSLEKEMAARAQAEAKLAAVRKVLDNEDHPKIQHLLEEIEVTRKPWRGAARSCGHATRRSCVTS